MRADPAAYELKTPRHLGEALGLIAAAPGEWTPLAGGTDLMVIYETGRLQARRLLSLQQLDELRGINVQADFIDLGALTTYAEIRQHAELCATFPCLIQAAIETGGLAIQNRGTIGGNIVNASPAADTPPALLVYDADVELVSLRGSRWLSYAAFHLGYKQHVLQADELLKTIRLRRPPLPVLHFYRKVGTRRAQAISKVVGAAIGCLDDGHVQHVRLAFGSVAPTSLRCMQTEQALIGQGLTPQLIDVAVAALQQEIAPIDDIRSTSIYRQTVAGNLVRQFLEDLRGAAGADKRSAHVLRS